jgi:peptidoglycan/LPS O-acetylase OafA/YrhL
MLQPIARVQSKPIAAPEPGRIFSLDGVRAVAVLAVFLNHALGVSLWMGVDLFFVLSGFLITGILLERKARKQSFFAYFYARRARRILPPYLLLLTLSSLLYGVGWLDHWWWYALFAQNIADALGKHGNPGFGVLWSLAIEEQFYLVWPLVVRFSSERALAIVAAAGIFVAPVLRAAATPFVSSFWPIYFLTPFRMDLLCAGALLAVLMRTNRQLPERLSAAAWIALCATLAVLFWLHRHYPLIRDANQALSNAALYSLTLVMSASIVILALNRGSVVARVLSNPLFVFIGTISYTIYLVHLTFIGFAWRMGFGRYESALAALVVTLAYATVSWLVLEKPLLLGGSRRTPACMTLQPDKTTT